MAVTAIGSVVNVSGHSEEDLKGRHAARHEQFRDFFYSSDCELVQVKVSRYILVNSLRDVNVVEISR